MLKPEAERAAAFLAPHFPNGAADVEVRKGKDGQGRDFYFIRTYGVPGGDLSTPADVLRFVAKNVFESE
jgi:hypothetical protein